LNLEKPKSVVIVEFGFGLIFTIKAIGGEETLALSDWTLDFIREYTSN